MTPQILRLRCVRCGDWHEQDMSDPYLPEICRRCFSKMLEAANAHSDYVTGLDRFITHYRRGTDRHPTVLRIAQALEVLWAKDGESPF